MARKNRPEKCVLLALAFALIVPACETAPVRNADQSDRPSPPEEVLQTMFIYPPDPIVLQFTQLRDTFTQLADQLTVLYLVGYGESGDEATVRCLIEVQKHYYRYGVQVMLLNLNPPEDWPNLKKMLEQNSANFPAAYLPPEQVADLKSFLHYPSVQGYHMFIIDDVADTQTEVNARLSCLQFRRLITDILTKRAGKKNVSR